MAYIPNYVARKHGREQIVYDIDDMKEYLEETYSITVYGEQVMLLSKKLAWLYQRQRQILCVKQWAKNKKACSIKWKDVLLKAPRQRA